MRQRFLGAKKWARHLHVQPPPGISFTGLPVETAPGGHVDLQTFQQRAFIPQKPFLIRKDTGSSSFVFPAAIKWFGKSLPGPNSSPTGSYRTFSLYLKTFQEWPFPYELMIPNGAEHMGSVLKFHDWLLSREDIQDQTLAEIIRPVVSDSSEAQRFFQLYAPLRLLRRAVEFNMDLTRPAMCPIHLYIAQSLISDLPQDLQDDIPTPELVLKAGKGDVYSSSIWLGAEPTYTPLHRDPNPNLFYQLCGNKSLRLLTPAHGDRVFLDIQTQLGRHGSSRIRTTEMMEGEERQMLHDIIWNTHPQENVYSVDVGPGDSLFIPKGWWHSVKSMGTEGGLNGSVNWWFR
ncbi:Bifunctional peptidase and arginyl-hydroxylase JMJD5-like protein [Cladobotryum mycophilum]|uniref:Bifunctional peptidase and arginyl-hydroxylase JMJD5-like protein n=1 Tax=Cladobotryum mycophilum TaxID=491253 RepID=A0ABR0SST2_9HYPO